MENKKVLLGSLLNCGLMPIRLAKAELPELKDSLGRMIRGVISLGTKEFVLTAVQPGVSETLLVTIQASDRLDDYPCAYYMDPKTEVEVLSTSVDFMKKYDKKMLKNLNDHLAHGFYIGSDPEIFVEDAKGEMIPSYLFLGSKEIPDRTPGTPGDIAQNRWTQFRDTGGNTMYWDGFQGEFTTKAGPCLEFHTDSVASGLRGVYDAARKKFPEAKLSLRSVYDIPFETLQTADEEHVAFGCMPSINAYGLHVNMPPCREVPFRSAGGHIHFGLGTTTMEQAIPIVKALDAILGVACVSLFAKYDDPKRRVLYGLPGEFRLPPHGLEYRPLSNAWMSHPFIMNLVFDLARKVVVFGQKGLLRYWEGTEKETVDTIINCDVDRARSILERNKPLFLDILQSAYQWASKSDMEKMYSIFTSGLESVVEDPTNFVVNWGLDDKQPWVARCSRRNVKGMIELVRAGKKVSSRAPEVW